jgi:hypothetical protein
MSAILPSVGLGLSRPKPLVAVESLSQLPAMAITITVHHIFSRLLVSQLRQMLCLKGKLNNHVRNTIVCKHRTITAKAQLPSGNT